MSQWLSQPHPRARENETALIAFCRHRYVSLNEGEYYADATAEEIITLGESLPASSADAETLHFERYGRNAGKGGCWPQEDPVIVMALSGDLLARLDADRGQLSRAEWLRDLTQKHLPSIPERASAFASDTANAEPRG